MRRILYFFLPVVLAMSFMATSCRNDCSDCDFSPVFPKHKRALFYYMGMDNNLSGFGVRNLDAMRRGTTAENMNGGAIVVFNDNPTTIGSNTHLIYLYADSRGSRERIIYEWDENLDSSDPEVLRMAFEKARELVNAESWALGVGSHGSGWLPATAPSSRALIDNRGSYMEMHDFVNALPAGTFDFAIMDLCYMGGVEFAYAMRSKVRYVVASPAEIMGDGMPYDLILKHIFADVPRLGEGGVAEVFYEYYLNNSNEFNRFGTIALYDCSMFGALAEVMSEVVAPKKDMIEAMTRAYLNTRIQSFHRPGTISGFRDFEPAILDLREFVYDLYPESEDDDLRRRFDEALDRAVIYKRTTEQRLFPSQFTVPKERYSGVGTYIPIGAYAALNHYYWQTAWAKAVYGVME
ncbi:MAG: clostripain-related cysteine peptidase [Rikenellaceae bacterium]|nr:clostripain-related cysteine peptidase [Rikenellaceae bacterium]MCL2692626.1 clostripain-related cysteine peptidase [Rikenellaceae bacterium]